MCLIACGPGPASAPRPAPPESIAAAPAAPEPAEPAVTIPEVEARILLAAMFREAGYRILYDVPVAVGAVTVAIDGFDPEREVGFEYRAASEAGAWNGRLAADSGARLLVIDAGDRDTVEARAREFLAANAAESTE